VEYTSIPTIHSPSWRGAQLKAQGQLTYCLNVGEATTTETSFLLNIAVTMSNAHHFNGFYC
jgi:hypothetical protein